MLPVSLQGAVCRCQIKSAHEVHTEDAPEEDPNLGSQGESLGVGSDQNGPPVYKASEPVEPILRLDQIVPVERACGLQKTGSSRNRAALRTKSAKRAPPNTGFEDQRSLPQRRNEIIVGVDSQIQHQSLRHAMNYISSRNFA